MMSRRFISNFLLCYESLDYAKLIFSPKLCIVKCIMWYIYELLLQSLLLDVFRVWQVSFEDECFPSGGDSHTSKKYR